MTIVTCSPFKRIHIDGCVHHAGVSHGIQYATVGLKWFRYHLYHISPVPFLLEVLGNVGNDQGCKSWLKLCGSNCYPLTFVPTPGADPSVISAGGESLFNRADLQHYTWHQVQPSAGSHVHLSMHLVTPEGHWQGQGVDPAPSSTLKSYHGERPVFDPVKLTVSKCRRKATTQTCTTAWGCWKSKESAWCREVASARGREPSTLG